MCMCVSVYINRRKQRNKQLTLFGFGALVSLRFFCFCYCFPFTTKCRQWIHVFVNSVTYFDAFPFLSFFVEFLLVWSPHRLQFSYSQFSHSDAISHFPHFHLFCWNKMSEYIFYLTFTSLRVSRRLMLKWNVYNAHRPSFVFCRGKTFFSFISTRFVLTTTFLNRLNNVTKQMDENRQKFRLTVTSYGKPNMSEYTSVYQE